MHVQCGSVSASFTPAYEPHHHPVPYSESHTRKYPLRFYLPCFDPPRSLDPSKKKDLRSVITTRLFVLQLGEGKHKLCVLKRGLCLCVSSCAALSLQTCRLCQCEAAAAEEESIPAGRDESMQRERGGGREHINVISPKRSFHFILHNIHSKYNI